MRTILFRGKTIENKWVYGDLIQIGGGALIYHVSKQKVDEIPQEDSPCAVGFYQNEISPIKIDTIEQFTGLLDVKDNKIFEGDIIKCYQADENIVFWYEDDGSWCISNYHASALPLGNYLHDAEVIGNIHDNPELLQ